MAFLTEIFKFLKGDPDDKLIALDPEPERKKEYMYMGDGTVEEVYVDTPSDIVSFDTKGLAPRGKYVSSSSSSSSNRAGSYYSTPSTYAGYDSGYDSGSSSSCDSGSSASCD